MTTGIIQTTQLKTDRLNNDLVKTHPCYSKDAHKYARMHLPVAPACNIQCNYCNRKFDCSNESRPGVVSALLSPAEAIKRFKTVRARMPELKVVGIAGPGDPLANPNSAIATLKGIRAIDDDVHLCISTNGLNLPAYVPMLAKIGVHHLTITINTLDPAIAANLYPWIYFNNQRYYGIEAAEILIKQQLAGLSLAAEHGILVKVNTVLVPGVNDAGLKDLALEMQNRGALLHNIMPLISDPSHGTFFGLNHIVGPTELQIEQAREVAGSNMPQMSHCKQCRADAVGTLDGDESGCQSAKVNAVADSAPELTAEPTLELAPELKPELKPGIATAPYQVSSQVHSQVSTQDLSQNTSKAPLQAPFKVLSRIAVASSDKALIDTHFGHAKVFHIYDVYHEQVTFVESRELSQYCHGIDECNDNNHENAHAESGLDAHIKCLQDCQIILCSRIGIGPWQTLEENNIKPQVDYAMLGVTDSLNTIRSSMVKSIKADDTTDLKEVG